MQSQGDTTVVDEDDPFEGSPPLDDLNLDDDKDVGDVPLSVESSLLHSSSSLEAKDAPNSPESDVPSTLPQVKTDGDEADPWAVLAAAAGEEPPKPTGPPAQSSFEAALSDADDATREKMERDTKMDEARAKRLAAASHFQTSAARLGEALGATLRDVDAKTRVSETTRKIDEKLCVSERLGEWKIGEKLGGATRGATEAVKTSSRNVTEAVRTSTSQFDGAAKEFRENKWMPIQQKVGETVVAPLGQRAQELGIASRWKSMSTSIGSGWKNATAGIGKFTDEKFKHVQVDVEKSTLGIGKAAEETQANVVESLAGGVDWVSERLLESQAAAARDKNPNGNVSASLDVREMEEMVSSPVEKDADGLPTSFLKNKEGEL